ncbi:MAG: carbon starvation protein A [Myxococcota bacterium]|nr:carbon starvation protein A [Myxococcota bacterium]
MSALIALAALAVFYFLGYRIWSRRLAEKVFGLQETEEAPAHALRDDVDFLPTDKHVLWGHHFTSIAGAAPIIGPAVAIIWGWVPALIWVVFGTIFLGAAHDFGAMVLGVRHQGSMVGDVAGQIIHPRVRILFQIIIYFLVWVVLAVFAVAIGVLFDKYPATVIPINFEIIVAVAIGFLIYKKNVPILWPSVIALVGLYAMIAVGIEFPVKLSPDTMKSFLIADSAVITWAIFLLVYAAVASILPVWVLLQPRDYINSHQLIVGLAFLILGLMVVRPEMVAPAYNPSPTGAPPIFPFIFVTIACGAISGFHGLVASGTTSKQLDKVTHARPIGYGAMLGEGMLAVIATVAVAAGLKDWDHAYGHWNSSGIAAIGHFVDGASTFLTGGFGMPVEWANALVAVLAISFAATSLDTGARVQRIVVSEFGRSVGIRALENRYVATFVAIVPAVPLLLAGKSAWGPLWLLFGTTNQLIGGMTFLVLFVYLFRARKPVLPYLIPMIFVLGITTGAMTYNLFRWTNSLGTKDAAPTLTLVIGTIILILEFWMIAEAVVIVRKLYKERKSI